MAGLKGRGEWRDQTPGRNIVGNQQGPPKCNPLVIYRRLQDRLVIPKGQSGRRFAFAPGGFETCCPVFRDITIQKGHAEEVVWRFQSMIASVVG